MWDVRDNPDANFKEGLAKPPLKLGYVWVIVVHSTNKRIQLFDQDATIICTLLSRDLWIYMKSPQTYNHGKITLGEVSYFRFKDDN